MARKQAIISCTLWLVISAFFVTVLFSTGIESFADPDKSWPRVLVVAGVVPVGWFYFLAYGCMGLVWLVHPAVTLVLDYGGKVDG